jgi:hypothetical protein
LISGAVIYRSESFAHSDLSGGILLDLYTHVMASAMKKCDHCQHSRAAHIEGRCALCGCTSEERTFQQESFAFRSALHRQVTVNTRKR